MALYSNFERNLSRILSKVPFFKKNIKLIYQIVCYFLYKKNFKYKTKYYIKKINSRNTEAFFGYYDKSPMNISNEWILFHEVPKGFSTKKPPSKYIALNIMAFNIKEKKYYFIAQTKSYNWQQGARLQWLDNHNFIFNQFNEDKKEYVSCIYNIKTLKKVKSINVPIYDTCSEFALTLNFDRLAELRKEYGYLNKKVDKLPENKKDGICLVDLKTNSCKLLISIYQIINFVNGGCINEAAQHKVNHMMINPSKSKFVFLHRYFIKGVKYDQLLLASKSGELLKFFDNFNMVSHYIWQDNDNLIAYARNNKGVESYFQINTNTGQSRVLDNELYKYGDGHPSIYKNKLLFDTYPNKARQKTLFIYDLKSKEYEQVISCLEPLGFYGGTRCDLHPRWSKDGKYIFIDSSHTGKRQLYMLEP